MRFDQVPARYHEYLLTIANISLLVIEQYNFCDCVISLST